MGLTIVVVIGLASAAVEVPPCSPARAPIEPVVEVRDGRKITEGNIRAGARDGRWTFYWPNGFKKEESLYCNGVRHGAVTFWYETGLPELEGTFEHATPRGAWTFWNSVGGRRIFYPQPARVSHDFFLEEGSRALIENDHDLAETLLRVALRNAPNEPRVHRALGVLAAKKGEGPKAAFHYRRYIELDPAAKDRATVENFLRVYEASRAPKPAAPLSSGTGAPSGATAPIKTTTTATDAPPTTAPPPTDVVTANAPRLSVITDRPARVILDGRNISGTTPLTGARALVLTPGPHRLTLEIDGTPPLVQVLEVTPTGGPGAATIDLTVGERFKVDGPITVVPAAP